MIPACIQLPDAVVGGLVLFYLGVAVGVFVMCLVAMNRKDRDE